MESVSKPRRRMQNGDSKLYQKDKTYSRRDSQMVTHSNTSRPVMYGRAEGVRLAHRCRAVVESRIRVPM